MIRIIGVAYYVGPTLRKLEYLPCTPTRGTEVPFGPDWFHEVKHDGYRLVVQRQGMRVRLLTRRGARMTAFSTTSMRPTVRAYSSKACETGLEGLFRVSFAQTTWVTQPVL